MNIFSKLFSVDFFNKLIPERFESKLLTTNGESLAKKKKKK